MKPKIKKSKAAKTPAASLSWARTPSRTLDRIVADAFKAVEPDGFGDHPDSSIEAAAVDPDVDDSEGGE